MLLFSDHVQRIYYYYDGNVISIKSNVDYHLILYSFIKNRILSEFSEPNLYSFSNHWNKIIDNQFYHRYSDPSIIPLL